MTASSGVLKGGYLVMPLLVAMMRMGAMSLSKARLRKEKHSMSNMCTSSMKSTCTCTHVRQINTETTPHMHTHTPTPAHTHTHTHTHTLYHTHGHTIQTHTLTPGTISALPSSLHSATFALICSRTSPLISPVSPALNRTCTQKKTTSISGHQQLRTRPTYELTKHGCLLVS